MSEKEKQSQAEGIRITLQSILVAFIFALIFRVFVVQAYVIPSGSMGPTLLGAHMRFRCPDCGKDFEVNYPVTESGDTPRLPSRAGPMPINRGGEEILSDTLFSVYCPNCGLKMPTDSTDTQCTAKNSQVHYGDRILVLKYAPGFLSPKRWDVAVFVSPPRQPNMPDYTVNFIKRLVGLPGERLMVLDGDVYTQPLSGGAWTIQRKPRSVQNAMWQAAYENDYYPTSAGTYRATGSMWIFPFKTIDGNGWDIQQPEGPGRVLKFDNASGGSTIRFNPDANAGTFPLTDWLAYDVTKPIRASENEVFPRGDFTRLYPDPYGQGSIPRWNVSDLKIQFEYRRLSGEGALTARLTKLGHSFVAEILPDEARVYHEFPLSAKRELIGKAPLAGLGDRLFIEFSNVDYRVNLRVNEKDLVTSRDEQYSPEIEGLKELSQRQDQLAMGNATIDRVRNVFEAPRVDLRAENQRGEISRLGLWRDIYYTPHLHEDGYKKLFVGRPDRPVELFDGKSGTHKEYFMLGDNSILSMDGRDWPDGVDLGWEENLTTGPGKVPDEFLLGKAFMVYWPSGLRPFTETAPPITPYFGKMRMIR